MSLLKLQNIFHSLDREVLVILIYNIGMCVVQVRCLASVLPLERRLPGEHVDNSQVCGVVSHHSSTTAGTGMLSVTGLTVDSTGNC